MDHRFLVGEAYVLNLDTPLVFQSPLVASLNRPAHWVRYLGFSEERTSLQPSGLAVPLEYCEQLPTTEIARLCLFTGRHPEPFKVATLYNTEQMRSGSGGVGVVA